MKAKGWKGATYGIRMGRANAERYFQRSWRHIEVDIEGEFDEFRLSSTFWTTCPEFRGAAIARWLLGRGLAPWPSGNPPEFDLIPLGGNRFRLSQ